MKTHPERILGVPRDALETAAGDPLPQGFIPLDRLPLDAILADVELRVRDDVEDDPSFKQLIPYVVLLAPQVTVFGSEAFCYRRGGGGGEPRLFGRWSLGVGGHIDEADVLGPDGEDLPVCHATRRLRLVRALRRELDEELFASYAFQRDAHHADRDAAEAGVVFQFNGLINDDSDPVGSVHLGVVATARLVTADVRVREGHALHTPGFASGTILRALRPQFETWSQIVIDRFWPAEEGY